MTHLLILTGTLYQKGNSRRLIPARGRSPARIIKSANALACVKSMQAEAKQQWKWPMYLGPVTLKATVFYPKKSHDLCTSLLKDLLQGIAYEDDAQVTTVYEQAEIDKDSPRVEVYIKENDRVDLLSDARRKKWEEGGCP